jgi:hypothetical protein
MVQILFSGKKATATRRAVAFGFPLNPAHGPLTGVVTD